MTPDPALDQVRHAARMSSLLRGWERRADSRTVYRCDGCAAAVVGWGTHLSTRPTSAPLTRASGAGPNPQYPLRA
jgi:hypothetical protein